MDQSPVIVRSISIHNHHPHPHAAIVVMKADAEYSIPVPLQTGEGEVRSYAQIAPFLREVADAAEAFIAKAARDLAAEQG